MARPCGCGPGVNFAQCEAINDCVGQAIAAGRGVDYNDAANSISVLPSTDLDNLIRQGTDGRLHVGAVATDWSPLAVIGSWNRVTAEKKLLAGGMCVIHGRCQQTGGASGPFADLPPGFQPKLFTVCFVPVSGTGAPSKIEIQPASHATLPGRMHYFSNNAGGNHQVDLTVVFAVV